MDVSMKELFTKRERADREYWNELAVALGWTLYGWTDRKEASFLIRKTGLVHVNNNMRDDIMKAIKDAQVREACAVFNIIEDYPELRL